MKRYFFILVGCMFWIASTQVSATPMPTQNTGLSEFDGGDPDKKKKKDDEEGEKKANTKYKPHIAAKNSAKQARYSAKMKDKQIGYRAKVRNIYHSTFNRKHGKFINFRRSSARKRWKRRR